MSLTQYPSTWKVSYNHYTMGDRWVVEEFKDKTEFDILIGQLEFYGAEYNIIQEPVTQVPAIVSVYR